MSTNSSETSIVSIGKEIDKEEQILATNAWHLARYIIEHDIDVGGQFNAGKFLDWCERYPVLDLDEKHEFVNQYASLEKAAKNVTARTLHATRIHGKGFLYATFRTSVGQYLLVLTIITFAFAYLTLPDLNVLMAGNLEHKGKILNPFGAAGLGTCVYLLRITQEKLRTREFDPAYIPAHMIRLALGILAGGSLVLFPELFATTIGNSHANIDVGIGSGALAFVFGYAVDIFYSMLDSIGGRVKSISK